MLQVFNNFVINPESYWRPSYRISPFNTSYNAINQKIADSEEPDYDLVKSFFGKNYILCKNGKAAIEQALAYYNLKSTDEVWIITTSGNKYISSCVTKEIEKFCKWSRERTDFTKLIFVNHEFGFCFKDLPGLKRYGLPIIEDRALSFNSVDTANTTGTVGDFVIYSLPKFFPISIGGVLQANIEKPIVSITHSDENEYIIKLLSKYLKEVDSINKARVYNYQYLSEKLAGLNLEPFFNITKGEIPGVYMFKNSFSDLNEMKIFMQANGVESSAFYGENAFFIPVHQNLSTSDMDFFYQLLNYFFTNGNK